MRTTLILDDDLPVILKKKASELGISFDEMVNQSIRSGLAESSSRKSKSFPKTIPQSLGFKPGIDLDKLNQLADVLEAEAPIDKIKGEPT